MQFFFAIAFWLCFRSEEAWQTSSSYVAPLRFGSPKCCWSINRISKRRCLVQPFGGIDLSVKGRLFRSYWISGLCSPAQAQAHHKQNYCPGVANTERVVQHLAICCVMSTMSYILSVWLILNLDFSLSWFSVFASLENLGLIFKNHPRYMEGQLCGGRDGRHLEDRMCLDVSDETSPSHSSVSFLVC